MEDANVWKQIVPDDEPQAEPKLGELMREQRNSRIVAGAYPDGNPNAGAIMAQTSQAEPEREPNPDEVICPACTHQFRAIPENVQKQLWAKREPLDDHEISKLAWQQNVWTDGMIEFSFLAFARAVERAHGIGGSDAE